MSCFSAPWGYFTLRGTTSTGALRAWHRSARNAIASGLFPSMPRYAFERPRIFRSIRVPPMIASACSSMSRWSAVRYGSHSTPFRMSASIRFSFGGVSFTWVGNAAPPRPTTPASRMRARRSSAESAGPVGRLGPRAAVGRLALGCFDDHGRHEARHRGMQVRQDRRHLPRDARVHGSRDEPARLADHLPRAHRVALLHQALRRSPRVHVEGDDDPPRQRHVLDGLPLGPVLVPGRVHSPPEGACSHGFARRILLSSLRASIIGRCTAREKTCTNCINPEWDWCRLAAAFDEFPAENVNCAARLVGLTRRAGSPLELTSPAGAGSSPCPSHPRNRAVAAAREPAGSPRAARTRIAAASPGATFASRPRKSVATPLPRRPGLTYSSSTWSTVPPSPLLQRLTMRQ